MTTTARGTAAAGIAAERRLDSRRWSKASPSCCPRTTRAATSNKRSRERSRCCPTWPRATRSSSSTTAAPTTPRGGAGAVGDAPPRVRVLRHRHNRGYGAAISTGFAPTRSELRLLHRRRQPVRHRRAEHWCCPPIEDGRRRRRLPRLPLRHAPALVPVLGLQPPRQRPVPRARARRGRSSRPPRSGGRSGRPHAAARNTAAQARASARRGPGCEPLHHARAVGRGVEHHGARGSRRPRRSAWADGRSASSPRPRRTMPVRERPSRDAGADAALRRAATSTARAGTPGRSPSLRTRALARGGVRRSGAAAAVDETARSRPTRRCTSVAR